MGKRTLRRTVLSGSFLVIAACGGGGGGSEASESDASTPVPATAASTSTSTLPASTTTTSTTTTAPPTTVATTTTTEAAPSVMPDFVGQTFDEAEALLRRYNARITKKVRISPEPAGTIVEQEPVGGAPFTPNVTLFVSVAPPAVPDAIGKSFGDAKADLERLGFSVIEVPTFDETRQDGLVLEQTPAAGTSNAGEVTLTVARTPVVFYLGYDLKSVTSSGLGPFETGTSNANGATYTHSIRLSTYQDEGASAEYNLGRSYRQFRSFVGIDDDSRDADAQYRVEILGDGRLLWGDTISLGETKEIDADVTGVLRLKIFIINLANANSTLVLGDVRLNGLPTEVPPTTDG